MEQKLVKPILCLATFLTCVLLAISRPTDHSVHDHQRYFGKTAIDRVVDDLQSGTAVYGVAPQVSATSNTQICSLIVTTAWPRWLSVFQLSSRLHRRASPNNG